MALPFNNFRGYITTVKNMHLHRDSNPGPWNTVPMLWPLNYEDTLKKHVPHIQVPEINRRGQTRIHQDTKTMALVQYCNIIFIAIPNLEFMASKENMFLHKKGIFSYINETGTSFLDYKHKYMLQKTELHLTNLVSCTVYYIKNFMVLAAGSMFQGYYTLVPGINYF